MASSAPSTTIHGAATSSGGAANHSVCVVGAGVVGVSTALALAERGYHVILIDDRDEVAGGASARNGGQLSYSFVDALGSPRLLPNLPKYAAGLDEAFRLNPLGMIKNVGWIVSFLRNCTQSRFEANTLAILCLASWSSDVMTEWRKAYDLAFHYRKAGKLVLVGSDEGLAQQRPVLALKQLLGTNQQLVSSEKALELEPALQSFQGNIAGAVYSPDDAVGDAQVFSRQLAAVLGTRYGADVKLSTRVEGVDMNGDQVVALHTSAGRIAADAFVFCAGMGTRNIAELWGEKLPLMPMAGYSLTYTASANAPDVSLTDSASKTVICRLNDTVRFAGLADLGEYGTVPVAARVESLKKTLNTRFGAMSEGSDDAEIWMGHRPMTPDCRPIVAPAQVRGVFLNCGHGMLGWTLAAGSARLLCRKVDEFLAVGVDRGEMNDKSVRGDIAGASQDA